MLSDDDGRRPGSEVDDQIAADEAVPNPAESAGTDHHESAATPTPRAGDDAGPAEQTGRTGTAEQTGRTGTAEQTGRTGTAEQTGGTGNAGDLPQSPPARSATGNAAPAWRQFRLRPVAMAELPVRRVARVVRRFPQQTLGVCVVVLLVLGVIVTAIVPAPAATLINLPAPAVPSSSSASGPTASDSPSPSESASASPTPAPSPTSPTPTRMAAPPRERVGGFPGTAPVPTATSAPATSAPATSAPATSAPATSAPGTSGSPTTTAPTTTAPTTTAPATTAPATPTTPAPQPGTLPYYLAQIPPFPARPAPAPVTFSHPAGQAAILESIPTSQNVAFLSIDDGFLQSSLIRELIRQSGVPVAIFLTTSAAADNPGYFQSLLHSGMVIDNHTVGHPDLATLTYEQQRAEICAASDQIQAWYGRRPLYMRPPYLSYNADTARAAWDCGIKAVVNANVGVENQIINYAHPDRTIHRGDIIVVHFDSGFADDFIAALWAIYAAGLTPALLTDYINVV